MNQPGLPRPMKSLIGLGCTDPKFPPQLRKRAIQASPHQKFQGD